VSLLGAQVPIPVTVKLDNIKVIRREKEPGEEGEEEEEETENIGPEIRGVEETEHIDF
jgi:hypothetical protein